MGKEGEQITAKVLKTLSEKHKRMFVFHSLSWPESNGDTDHIIIYGDTVFIIDSKRWKSSRKYSVTPSGTILRGTVAFPEGKVKIVNAMGTWRKKLSGMKVRGIVTIAQEKVFVSRDKNWYRAPFRLVETELLEEFLEEQFTKIDQKGFHKTPADTLIKLGKLLVKPYNKQEEIILMGAEESTYEFNKNTPHH